MRITNYRFFKNNGIQTICRVEGTSFKKWRKRGIGLNEQGRISPVKADDYYFCLRRDRRFKLKYPGLHCRVAEANFGIPPFGAFVEIREEQIEDCRNVYDGGTENDDDDDQFDDTIPFNIVKTPVEEPVERELTLREEYEEMRTVLLQRIRDRTGISKSSYQANFVLHRSLAK